jgi:hypothetical protein
MLFTEDTRLAKAIRDPVDEHSPLFNSIYKAKEYTLILQHCKKCTSIEEFDINKIELELSQPLTFKRNGAIVY